MKSTVSKLVTDTINLSHGSGGKAMKDLIEDVFLKTFNYYPCLEDQARVDLNSFLQSGSQIAFTTDSYVIDPLFFAGGDIGSLAVNGTVNDLCVGGADPKFLSLSVILEEGLPVKDLRRIATSLKNAADLAGVKIVTGDTKVVERGACDKIFINTAGIGVIQNNVNISVKNAREGDRIIINGSIGDHGAAIMSARKDLALENNICSDTSPLNGLVSKMLAACPEIHAMRDATRGGIASVLNEIAHESGVGIKIYESKIAVKEEVRAVCEILGLDPLYIANEGKLVAVVPAQSADRVLKEMREHQYGREAEIVGEVIASSNSIVVLKTSFGGERIVDMLIGEQLPRIC